ncbi:hypothetical protein C2I27_03450 [Priestia megaterium]|uniref:hypothetical protein n=1 Tax=Priestia megaterium TaxID=1404 RepID=UPI000D516C16|nr:hypothetical protein [Priestia megaterium]PVC74954.1 hypothetical protein C2I27_03450 [Priestia megaterium]
MNKVLTAAAAHSLSTLKDLTSVSLSFTYKTNAGEPRTRNINMNLDYLKAKVMNLKNMKAFRKKKEHTVQEEFEVMAAYKYKVIWLNEMGIEQDSFHETEEERNAKLQALADDGYSPVWREIE